MLLSDPRTYRSSTESSEAATEDFAALQESPGAPLEVVTQNTIAIRESPGAPLEASDVATEYTFGIQESLGGASRPLGEPDSVLRLHSPVPEKYRRVCRVRHSKSTSVTCGGFRGFRDRTFDFADTFIQYEASPSVSYALITASLIATIPDTI
ncbi:hypothetical protein BDD12DRAFT_890621 [Trichophaea hybrida]|nr:hypothetical protein BDD12DRAFT_890621 [Trichophaea hybrida]